MLATGQQPSQPQFKSVSHCHAVVARVLPSDASLLGDAPLLEDYAYLELFLQGVIRVRRLQATRSERTRIIQLLNTYADNEASPSELTVFASVRELLTERCGNG